MRRLAILTATILMMVTIGCASYYKVTDPGSGKVYYTDEVDREHGSVVFKDVNTRTSVTLQSAEVLEILKDEFKANTGKK